MFTAASTWRALATIGAGNIIASAALAAALAAAPLAAAVPGDPMPGCQPQMLQDICDGPIRSDNTFKRCTMSHVGVGASGVSIQPASNCWIVDLKDSNPKFGFGFPKNHID